MLYLSEKFHKSLTLSNDERKLKTALSVLCDADAHWHIVSLPLTEFTPSPQALHAKQA
jgi:hypothetical protein